MNFIEILTFLDRELERASTSNQMLHLDKDMYYFFNYMYFFFSISGFGTKSDKGGVFAKIIFF